MIVHLDGKSAYPPLIGEHDKMNRRAIACFDLALADLGLANNDLI
jgi:hypothetical protein